MLAWVFFRAKGMQDALEVLKKISLFSFSETIKTPLNRIEMLISIGLIMFLLWKEFKYFQINTQNTFRFYGLMVLFVISIYFLGIFETNQFIYFQF